MTYDPPNWRRIRAISILKKRIQEASHKYWRENPECGPGVTEMLVLIHDSLPEGKDLTKEADRLSDDYLMFALCPNWVKEILRQLIMDWPEPEYAGKALDEYLTEDTEKQ